MRLYVSGLSDESHIATFSGLARQLAIDDHVVGPGFIDIPDSISLDRILLFRSVVLLHGHLILNDESEIIAARVFSLIRCMVDDPSAVGSEKLSNHLSRETKLPYAVVVAAFTSSFGVTPRRCLVETRVDSAKRLLLHSGFSVEIISVMLGYSSMAHLTAQFKSVVGCTPLAYRKRTCKGAASESGNIPSI